MSQENVEAFKRGVEASNRGEVEALLRELDPGVEWHMAIQELVGGEAAVYRGHDGVREYLRDMDEAFAEVEADYTEIRDLGDRVLATGSFRARGRQSGAVLESPLAALVDINAQGKAARVLTYLNREEALEAAGLSEQPISAQNVELTLRQVDAVNRRDAEAFVATLSPDVEWEDALFWTDVTHAYRGREEVREWFNQVVIDPWESLECGIEELAEGAHDRFLFGGLLTASGRDGVETQLHFWTVTWSGAGTVTKRQVFLDRAEALEAAGLSD